MLANDVLLLSFFLWQVILSVSCNAKSELGALVYLATHSTVLYAAIFDYIYHGLLMHVAT